MNLLAVIRTIRVIRAIRSILACDKKTAKAIANLPIGEIIMGTDPFHGNSVLRVTSEYLAYGDDHWGVSVKWSEIIERNVAFMDKIKIVLGVAKYHLDSK